jgi:hypothetical protein
VNALSSWVGLDRIEAPSVKIYGFGFAKDQVVVVCIVRVGPKTQLEGKIAEISVQSFCILPTQLVFF